MSILWFISAMIFLVTSVCATPSHSTNPVCVVGAGPGGLTIAHELEAKGYSTVVFDNQPEVGGKCQEYYDGHNQ